MGRRCLVGLAAILAFGVARSFEPASNQSVQVHADEQVTAEPRPAAANHRPTERQLKAYVLLAALAGIVIAGVGLAAMIILWAGRLRRQIRKPMPECESPDRDFWFLKPPKPTVRNAMLSDSHLPPHDAPPGKNDA